MSMVLKDTHATQDEIPEQYRELYTEKGGRWELTGIQGVKTQGDIDRVQESLRNEKDRHKETKAKVAVWGDLVHEDVVAILDRVPELESAAKGKLDETAIEEIVARRVAGTIKSQLAPIERENGLLKKTNGELLTENGNFRTGNTRRKIGDSFRKELTAQKVRPEAFSDALMLADTIMEIREDDGAIVTCEGLDGISQGLSAEQLLQHLQTSRPHWWPDSKGTGSRGSGGGGGPGGKNPWTEDQWNLTDQGKFLTEHGRQKADQAAKAAGSHIGATRPTVKKS
jgi:hypothetical protein